MLNIVEGKVKRPIKCVIYGSEGIGKSTLASQFPDPLFIDTEGGTASMNVRRINKPADWDELLNIIAEVARDPDVCKTLVLDTADWAEQLCIENICRKYKQNSIESFGYGKGYTYLSEEFSKLLQYMDTVIKHGKHVVVTAHAKMRKFEQPDEMGAYDRWELKLSRQVAPLLKEWCDMLLFINYKTYVITTENNTQKVQGGKRVMYTTHHPCWDAKNRHGLPEEMELSFSGLAELFADPQPQIPPKPVEEDSEELTELYRRMVEAEITEDEMRWLVAARGKLSDQLPVKLYAPTFISGWIFKYWDNVVSEIYKHREEK